MTVVDPPSDLEIVIDFLLSPVGLLGIAAFLTALIARRKLVAGIGCAVLVIMFFVVGVGTAVQRGPELYSVEPGCAGDPWTLITLLTISGTIAMWRVQRM